MPQKLTGPFGFWTFPLLKIVIGIFHSNRYSNRYSNKFSERNITDNITDKNTNNETTPTAELPDFTPAEPPAESPVIVNTEKWSWTDYKGVKQEITVKREKKIKNA